MKIIGNLRIFLENSRGVVKEMMTTAMDRERKRREMKRQEKGK